jgi:hypothetical protein
MKLKNTQNHNPSERKNTVRALPYRGVVLFLEENNTNQKPHTWRQGVKRIVPEKQQPLLCGNLPFQQTLSTGRRVR